MSFTLRPDRRFPVQCAVTYNAGSFQRQGTVWNLSHTGWRLSGDLPMRQGKSSRSPSIEQCIEVPGAVVERSRENERRLEPMNLDTHAHARLDNIWQVY
jgi:hypothetical protein